MEQQDVIAKVKSKKEKKLKRSVLLVCAAVEKVVGFFEERIDYVDSNKCVGYRVSWKVAFVEEKIFVNHVGLPIEAVGSECKLSRDTIFGPANHPIHGVFVPLIGLPADMPHYVVEQFYDVSRRLKSLLLSPHTTMRDGQAADRFSLAAKQAVTSRPQSMQNDAKCIAYSDIMAAAKMVKDKQMADIDTSQKAAKIASASVTTQSSSRLHDGGDFPVDKSGKKSNVKKGKKGGDRASKGCKALSSADVPGVSGADSILTKSQRAGQSSVRTAPSESGTSTSASTKGSSSLKALKTAEAPECSESSASFLLSVVEGRQPGRELKSVHPLA